jgi:hypothetical protein
LRGAAAADSVWGVEEEGSMSIEGMLCAAGLVLLAAGLLVRSRAASMSSEVPATVPEAGSSQGQVPELTAEQSPGWWLGTAALWLGVASLVAAGGLVFLRVALFSAVS